MKKDGRETTEDLFYKKMYPVNTQADYGKLLANN